LPGEDWTDPDWTAISGKSGYKPDSTWNASGKCEWKKRCYSLPTGFAFDNPAMDNSLHYVK